MSDPKDYTVGWICAIVTEYVAAQAFLDERHDGPKYVLPHDNNDYTLGNIGKHNVVIAVLPEGEYGISSATSVARDMLHTFPNVRIGLMVGIGGGAPSSKHDIRLGDIVVSTPRDGKGGVFQYDFGKAIQDQSFQPTGFLNQPPTVLRTAVTGLKAQYESEGHRFEEAINSILEKKLRLREKYQRPAPSSDRLYQTGVVHPLNDERNCAVACGDHPLNLEPRGERTEVEDNPAIHYGLIASANQLMKDALLRDKFAKEYDILCFEMEAAGLMNQFPCLVIRGICDYSDTHKNKEWQGYAAMAAAAYAKDLLCRILPNKVEAESRISAIFSSALGAISNTRTNVETIRSRLDRYEKVEILTWLTPIDYGPQQSDNFKRRQSGTGQWLLDSGEYQTWLTTDEQTLFCPGIPGAGKTILTSIIRKYEQKIDDLLESLLKQLVQSQSSLPIFVIIDALDECQASDGCRARLLSELFTLQNIHKTNILATSRFIPDIVNQFEGKSESFEIRASREDNQQLQSEIKVSISEAVDRKFLLAQIYIRSLNDKVTSKAIRDVLQDIRKQTSGLILSWITCAKRQITTTELRRSLAVEFGKPKLDKDNLPEIQDMVSVYARLVTVDEESNIIWLVHYTTQEYLEKTWSSWFPDAQKDIIKAYVTYLSYNVFQTGFCQSDKEFEARLQTNILYDYAARYWGHHAHIALITEDLILNFLESRAKVSAVRQAMIALEGQIIGLLNNGSDLGKTGKVNADLKNRYGQTPLSLAAVGGNGAVAKLLLETVKVDADSKDQDGQTPLSQAAAVGHETVAKLLLETGKVNTESKDSFGQTPLSRAAGGGNEAAVELLLETGKVDADSRDQYGRTPLSKAAANRHEAVVKLLQSHSNLS
ncbi:purine and uridine phosphorylase [Lindgomyces ingoldianus]|uniref:Purine and uridine phosphorylase n=1 Tax=Lindgomyces ingoldianus TaxID=673940 RepID=A0ACB6QIJ3_9PLEO|nr:purine and uridine phosphorylase [Lindgomyces ingoldianus]KAF2465937.1 purine and uridine phosphorylase [Lindgomyces ingoldianus]